MAATPNSPAVRADRSAPGFGRCTFGLFDLDLETSELRRSGRLVHLAPQPTRVLVLLVERAGQLVTRDELKAQVWGTETFVDFEQGLTFCIKQIRGALGDAAENPRFIETVPRRGYRWIAPVERLRPAPAISEPHAPTNAGAPWWQTSGRMAIAALSAVLILGAAYFAWSRVGSTPASPARSMIAVLPFELLGGEAEQEYLAAGFAGELIAQLGQVSPERLAVIARTSTLAYRGTTKSAAQIGRELGVQHLVEGTVQKSGDNIRVNAQLIRVSDQSHVWAEIFEGDVREILKLQREVGQAIARHVVGTLSPDGASVARGVDPVVYDLYLRSRAVWNRRSAPQDQAIAGYREAIRRDSGFAPAYAGLADSLAVTQPAAALAAAEHALGIDDRIAEAHSARAHVLMHMLQWPAAEQAFQRAMALDPSYVPARYFYGEFLGARGRCAEATAQARQAVSLDPFSAIATHGAGVIFYYCGDYDEALRHFRRALDWDPEHHWSHARIGLVFERRRDCEAAIAEFDLGHQRLRSVYSRAAAGRLQEARPMIEEALGSADTEAQSFQLAGAYVGLGDHAAALKWLDVAVTRRVYDVVYLAVDPRLESLRPRPQFQELLRRAGFTTK